MSNYKSFFRKISLLAAFALFIGSAGAQDAKAALQETLRRYSDSSFLSFDLAYSYAMLDDPGSVLDSLSGQFQMQGNKYWYKLDKTEVATNGDMLVMLFEEDNVMYLARPQHKGVSIGPVLITDSLIEKAGFTNIVLEKDKSSGDRVIRLNAAGNAAYRSIIFYIDPKSLLIKRAVYEVTAEQLYDETVRAQVDGGKTKYAKIDVLFSNYSRTDLNAARFDVSRYFVRDKDQWVTTPAYNSYKIFIGTPNL